MRDSCVLRTANRQPLSANQHLKLLIEPCCDEYPYDADEIRSEADAEVKLYDAQVQENILKIKNFESLGQVGHEADEICTAHELP